MKSNTLLFSFFFLTLFAQDLDAQTRKPLPPYNPGFLFSLRGGYDLPFYQNYSPYISDPGGLSFGTSLDYYHTWFGGGLDFDLISNQPTSIYPTNNLTYLGSAVQSQSADLTENGTARVFLGLGPSFRLEPSNRFTAELKLRGGIGIVSGGRMEHIGRDPYQSYLLNFHAGYDSEPVLSAKAQLQFNYFFNDYFGLHAGVYSMGHFGVYESYDSYYGISSGYIPFEPQFDPKQMEIYDPHRINYFSLGAFVGITLRLPTGRGHGSKSSLTVTAKDSLTGELLPNTEIALKNFSRTVVLTGKTDDNGEFTFSDIVQDDYTIEGSLDGTKLSKTHVMREEFMPGKNLKKQILYSNLNFIIKVKTVFCNTNTPLQDVLVTLKNTQRADVLKRRTDTNGELTFHVDQKSTYLLLCKKDYFLNTEETISTKDYDRSKTLFVRLGLCMIEIDCDTSKVLENIYYDYNDSTLKEEYKIVLDTLVQFMKDYPILHVEIGSHTDSDGSDSFNEILSQGRANSVVKYLISKKIDSKRLSYKGFGERKPAVKCDPCTEKQKQMNRRTVFKVICLNKK